MHKWGLTSLSTEMSSVFSKLQFLNAVLYVKMNDKSNKWIKSFNNATQDHRMSRNGELLGMVLLNMYDERINTKSRYSRKKMRG